MPLLALEDAEGRREPVDGDGLAELRLQRSPTCLEGLRRIDRALGDLLEQPLPNVSVVPLHVALSP
jgi:hypothetical protein